MQRPFPSRTVYFTHEFRSENRSRITDAASSDGQGYEAVFEPEVESKYVCPVCLATMRDPVQTKCGHRFCSPCLKRTIGLGRYARCPFDNSWYDTHRDVYLDNAAKREILSLKVKCDLHEEGCPWTGELRDLQKHRINCKDLLTSCTLNCGTLCKKRLLDEHLTQCPKLEKPCEHCGVVSTIGDLPKHQLLACTKFPVSCTKCGIGGISRDEIDAHVDRETGTCPMVPVNCAYQYIGCYFQDVRKNMCTHYELAWNQHLSLMSIRVTQNEEISASLQKELNQTRASSNQEVGKLRRRCKSLEKKIKSQELKIQQLDDGQRSLQSECEINVTESTAF